MFESEQLIEGNVYTRDELRQKFNIRDATLNNGVFQPSGYQSVWLFVTEEKAADIPQLKDLLDKDILYWDGQPFGRTDKQIIEHETNNIELLVFYRKHMDCVCQFLISACLFTAHLDTIIGDGISFFVAINPLLS